MFKLKEDITQVNSKFTDHKDNNKISTAISSSETPTNITGKPIYQ